MAIEYVEIRDFSTRALTGIVDTAKSVIWHAVYYGVGDFEIYAPATPAHLDLLQTGRYVTRPDSDEVGCIERVELRQNPQDGSMLTASGRFAKSILDRRHIYKMLSLYQNTATILRGNVEAAVRQVVSDNAIACGFDAARNIDILTLGRLCGDAAVIVDENGKPSQKQVSYDNLLTYTDGVLQEYGLGAKILLDKETKKLQYLIYRGADRSADNTDGNAPVIFSREYDNLTSSTYTVDIAQVKNAVLIGGAGEGLERFYTLYQPYMSGIFRRETWVDASRISKKYKDDNGEEKEYNSVEYDLMLKEEGKQKLATTQVEETFDGEINTTFGAWRLNRDYNLGDVVTVQDNRIGKYADVRITEITEVQDENGYSIEAKYQQEA